VSPTWISNKIEIKGLNVLKNGPYSDSLQPPSRLLYNSNKEHSLVTKGLSVAASRNLWNFTIVEMANICPFNAN